MKKILFVLTLLSSLFSNAQNYVTDKTYPDTLIIIRDVDDMTDKEYYYPSMELIVSNTEATIGMKMDALIRKKDNKLNATVLKIKMVNIGACNENNELILLFEDGTKIILNSFNSYNCEGNTWFNVTSEHINTLSSKKLSKVRITNGRTNDVFTGIVLDKLQDYYIRLYKDVKENKYFTYKE
jgi:hypothetical protein